MHDLVVSGSDRWEWNGRAYIDTLPAPQVNLHPRHRVVKKTHPTQH
jgi:hypothetical protein